MTKATQSMPHIAVSIQEALLAKRLLETIRVFSEEHPTFKTTSVGTVLVKVLAGHTASCRIKTLSAETMSKMLGEVVMRDYMRAHAFIVENEAKTQAAV